MKHLVNFLKNRIWFVVAAVLFALLTVQGCGSLFESSVALEQSVRCGTAEHVHAEACYVDEILICGKKAHTHGENCYIFRVGDNDINAILTDMGEKGINSLEDYMAHNLAAVYGEGQGLDDYLHYASVEELNAALSTTHAKALRLNADADLPATYAIGDNEATSAGNVNVYIYVDESDYIFVGSAELSKQESGRNYRYAAVRTDIAALFSASVANKTLVTTVTSDTLGSTHSFKYGTSKNEMNSNARRVGNGNVYLGFGENNALYYAVVGTVSGNDKNQTITPINFYTVTLDYSLADDNNTAEVQYVQSGQDSTLQVDTENYTWYTSKDDDAAALSTTQIENALDNISSKTTLYARPNSHTVTYDWNYDGRGTYTTQSVKNNQTTSPPPSPDRTGYTFDGWYTDKKCTASYNFDTFVTSSFTLYANWKPNPCTVTYKDGGGNKIQDSNTVDYGSSVTLPTGYIWTDGTNTYAGGATVAIYGDTDFVGTLAYTVSFNSNGGTPIASQSVISGGKAIDPGAPGQIAGHTFAGWYLGDSLYHFSDDVTGNITLTAKWTPIECTLYFRDGDTGWEDKADYGTTIALPEATYGNYWLLEGGGIYNESDSYTVTGDATFTSTDKVCATYVYEDGTSTTSEAVAPGTVITLPETTYGKVWLVEGGDGTRYYGGDSYTISENTTFVESSVLTVHYDVGFPTTTELSNVGLVLKTSGSEATLVGANNLTVVSGENITANDVSDRNVDLCLSSTDIRYSVAHFYGWETEAGDIISPNSRLTYEQLSAYDDNGDGTVTLTGQWTYHRNVGVNFFIRYNIGTNITNITKDQYTDVVFTTFAGGVEPYDGTGTEEAHANDLNALHSFGDNDGSLQYNAEDYYGYDQAIRALYGEKADGMWLAEFPSDAAMLEVLKTVNTDSTLYAAKVSTGDMVPVADRNELSTDEYTIRWYAIKMAPEGLNTDYTWHIDGLLVKKEGSITVDKLFGGVDTFIADGKNGFHVHVVAGTKDENGNFTAFTGDDAKQYVLYLSDVNTVDRLKELYPDTLSGIDDQYFIAGTLGDDGKYHWKIDGMELGEIWQITEHPPDTEDNYAYYAEYTVTDSDGTTSAIAEYGTLASVVGKVYALDEDPDQGLTVEFSNYYYNSESILIKKEDADTGKPIGNTAFEFYQDGKLLQFELTNGSYTQNPDGAYSQITTADDGFSTIALNGFNFQQGEITVKEVSAPHGYKLAPQIIINGKTELQDDGTYVTTDISIVGVDGVEDSSQWSNYAEYIKDDLDGDGTTDVEALIIKDKSVTVDVIANKVWPDGKSAESVTLVLQADGTRATNIFPGIKDVEVVLNSTNSWTYRWDNLPAYANGKLVSWSIKEIKIGDETTMVGSDNFAYWVHTYTTSQGDTDGDGVTEWYLTAANRTRRSMLVLTKTDVNGNPLADADFALTPVEVVDGAWNQVSGAVVRTGSSDINGELSFDNLDLTVYYCLSEIQPPLGYTRSLEDVVLSLDGSGVVYVCSIGEDGSVVKTPLSDYGSSYIVYDSAYNITVRNEAVPEFPATGDGGTDIYTRLGALLMLAAAAAVIYKTKGRKEGDASAV